MPTFRVLNPSRTVQPFPDINLSEPLKGAVNVIIYGRGWGGANPKIACTKYLPPLGARAFLPPPRILLGNPLSRKGKIHHNDEPPLGVIREQGEWPLRPKGAGSMA